VCKPQRGNILRIVLQDGDEDREPFITDIVFGEIKVDFEARLV